jgi:hypothetical protein
MLKYEGSVLANTSTNHLCSSFLQGSYIILGLLNTQTQRGQKLVLQEAPGKTALDNGTNSFPHQGKANNHGGIYLFICAEIRGGAMYGTYKSKMPPLFPFKYLDYSTPITSLRLAR